ncbi:BTB/POZ protein [Jimgerdemannia flammicorona]|uniref:BTB/POZ protein n=1 Tax=Jimgerdemannia flammicorona TaxID=994334 RepID=A0A433DCN3_9FUNG|nr:BTB/POZ protein [Jimgerdemannia flammicorona]
MSDRVVLNVGGRRFVTFLSTLRQFPDTVLGTMFAEDNMPMAKTVDPQEYFFDRNGDVFAVIIEFYRNGGRLFLPDKWEKFTREMLGTD